ncbi:MAG: dTMP kinase [bacterium]|nr:dTMP kinase [bacterium]
MFIVIEGIDGAGCETQAKLLAKQLSYQDTGKSRLAPTLIKFPHYDTPVGKMIKEFLYENKSLKAHEQFLLYTLQFIFDSPQIRNQIEKSIVIADRYFTTSLCYQTLEGFDEKVALKYADDFGIIRPDVVFYLDVKPETAIKWKFGENKEKNFREKDHEFIKKTYVKYDDLINRQVWTKWVRINGEQPKEKVTEEILHRLI